MNTEQTFGTCMMRAFYAAIVLMGLVATMTAGSLKQAPVFKPVPYALGEVQSDDFASTQAVNANIALQDNQAQRG